MGIIWGMSFGPSTMSSWKITFKRRNKMLSLSFCFVMQIANDTGEVSCMFIVLECTAVQSCAVLWDDSRKHQNRRSAKYTTPWPSVYTSLSVCVFSEVQGLICISAEEHRCAQLWCQWGLCAVRCWITAAKLRLCDRAQISKWMVLNIKIATLIFLINQEVHSKPRSNTNPVHFVLPF